MKEGTAFQAGSSNRQTYGYDGFGNLTSTTSWVSGVGTTRTNSVVGTTNRLSAAGYDGAGNQTTWGTYGYTWDLMGLMKAYQGSGNDWAYAYDVDDERMLVYNVVTGQSTFRIRGLDGKVLREVKLTGSTWSWGKDWIYRDGQLLATAAPGSVTRYAHADHLGSPRLFTDASGNAQERFHYYPFGEQAGTAPATPEALRFTGHERDSGASTGTADDLDYMHARYYHPQLGRFLLVDPSRQSFDLRTPASWNRYTYALNDPIKHVDPDGKAPKTIFKGNYQFHIHLDGHGGPHVDISEKAGGRWNTIGRVRLPELTPIKHMGNLPKIPNKAMKLLRGALKGSGIIGAIFSVTDADALNEDNDMDLMIREQLTSLAASRGINLADLSDEEIVALLEETLEIIKAPLPMSSPFELRENSDRCLSAMALEASQGSPSCL